MTDWELNLRKNQGYLGHKNASKSRPADWQYDAPPRLAGPKRANASGPAEPSRGNTSGSAQLNHGNTSRSARLNCGKASDPADPGCTDISAPVGPENYRDAEKHKLYGDDGDVALLLVLLSTLWIAAIIMGFTMLLGD